MATQSDPIAAAPATDVRARIWLDVKHYLSEGQLSEVKANAQRLEQTLASQSKRIQDCTVMVAYGGGKDSSYMTAFVRLVQIHLSLSMGQTFQLRVITNRHAAMSQAVMDNVHRVYTALGCDVDRDVETYVIDGHRIRPFARELPFPDDVRERNRQDVLMNGHRFGADARSTFCNACNLSMVNAFGIGAAHKNGVDAIVTGDSLREQRSYIAWTRQMAKRFRVPRPKEGPSFAGFMKTMNGISQAYARDLWGGDGAHVEDRQIFDRVNSQLRFFSIYQDTSYAAGDHWEFLVDFLGFQFDELMFSFSESDCGNPSIMAHMRGLKAQYVFGSSYEDGIREYVDFGLEMMKQKDFPPRLIRQMQARFDSPAKVRKFREKLDWYSKASHRLNEEQLICLVHAPFVDRGKGIRAWLESTGSNLVVRERNIHQLLGDIGAENDDVLVKTLERMSGLSLSELRRLYRLERVPNLLDPRASGHALAQVLVRDPHKRQIVSKHSTEGPSVEEIISGR